MIQLYQCILYISSVCPSSPQNVPQNNICVIQLYSEIHLYNWNPRLRVTLDKTTFAAKAHFKQSHAETGQESWACLAAGKCSCLFDSQ